MINPSGPFVSKLSSTSTRTSQDLGDSGSEVSGSELAGFVAEGSNFSDADNNLEVKQSESPKASQQRPRQRKPHAAHISAGFRREHKQYAGTRRFLPAIDQPESPTFRDQASALRASAPEPLELPAIASPSKASTDHEGQGKKGKLQYGPLQDEYLTHRILSLPNVVCHSASGDLFLVGLSEVQKLLQKTHPIGGVGFEGSVKTRRKKRSSTKMRRSMTSGYGDGGGGSQAGGEGGGEEHAGEADSDSDEGEPPVELDEEVRRRLDAATITIELRRQELADKFAARFKKDDDNEDAEAPEAQEVVAQGFTLLAKRALGRKLAAARRRADAAKQQAALDEERLKVESELAGMGGALAGKWRNVVNQRLLTLMSRWGAGSGMVEQTTRTGHRKQNNQQHGSTGWDAVMYMQDMYVKNKGAGVNNGSSVYEQKCHELGVHPSTQVMQQLGEASANLAHCKLGRHGAAALRHALAANCTITALDLADNGLDAVAVAEVMRGLTAGRPAGTLLVTDLLEGAAGGAAAANALGPDRWAKLEMLRPAPRDIVMRIQPVKHQHGGVELPVNSAPPKPRPAPVPTVTIAPEDGSLPPPTTTDSPLPSTDNQPSTRDSTTLGDILSPGPPNISSNGTPPPHSASSSVGPGGTLATPRTLMAPLLLTSHSAGPRRPRRLASGKLGAATMQRVKELAYSKVRELDLSGNPLGVLGAQLIAAMLDPALTPGQFLEKLTLNKCGITEPGGIALANAIANDNCTLTTLRLSNNMIGNKTAGILGSMLDYNTVLSELQLAWNGIGPEGCEAIAIGLTHNKTLSFLDLSWNGLENEGVIRLGTMLCTNNTLTHLDLTNTRMAADACLVLGEGLKSNQSLTTLILNGNAVGEKGGRYLMNALRTNDSLQFLGLEGTNMTSAVNQEGGGGVIDFNPLAPEGSYMLHLKAPAERAVAVQLCDMDQRADTDLMKHIRIDGRYLNASVKALQWPERLPHLGVLQCDFVGQRSRKTVAAMDPKKFSVILSQMASKTMGDKERLGLVEMMAPFVFLTGAQVSSILECFNMGEDVVTAAAVLFARVCDETIHLPRMLASLTERDAQKWLELLAWYAFLRFNNVTGHYELNLSLSIHQMLANRLKDIAYSEAGDSAVWINIAYDHGSTVLKIPGNHGPPEVWKGLIPNQGTLVFDYVSFTPMESPVALTDDQLTSFLVERLGVTFDETGAVVPVEFDTANSAVALLRQESVGIAVTCEQARRVAACFPFSPHKVEVVVILYGRVVDPDNLWVVLYSLTGLEQANAVWRLGPLNAFNPRHPSMHYVLDVSNPAHEEVAKKLVNMAVASPELPNIWNLRVQGTRRSVNENANLWGLITSETFTPFLEFDFIGADGWELAGKRADEVAAMKDGDKLEARAKQAARYETARLKKLYTYYSDRSAWQGPAWCSRSTLMKPSLDKPPWLAAWDRLIRVLVRYETRVGGFDGDSNLEDLYERYNEHHTLDPDNFDQLLKDCGYTKAEKDWYQTLFDNQCVASGRPQNLWVISYSEFISIFMQDPPAGLKDMVAPARVARDATLTGKGKGGKKKKDKGKDKDKADKDKDKKA